MENFGIIWGLVSCSSSWNLRIPGAVLKGLLFALSLVLQIADCRSQRFRSASHFQSVMASTLNKQFVLYSNHSLVKAITFRGSEMH